ncbi:MAG: helix-turn-helix transcriptional regulator [Phycisphaerales bacterium]|nr:helix-turn-helix transcriptional regulator [Phycisphaerales bacterium]
MLPEHAADPDTHVRLHALREVGPFRISLKSYSPAFTQPWHEHDLASIDFVLAGAGVGTYNGREIVSVGGAVEYFAAGIRHRFTSGARGIRTLHVVLPPDLPALGGIDADTLVRELDGSAALGPATSLLEELLRPDADPLVLESLAMRLLDAVAGSVRAQDRGGWLRTVRDILIEEPGLATSLGAVAARVDRHPAHLAREFRREYGVTVGEFGRRVRLNRAGRMLAAPERPALSRIAYHQGFSDQAHFTRSFRSHTGRAPGAFRERLTTAPGR